MIHISRQLALNKLECLYTKEGFSLLTVRSLINQIYDSFETSGLITQPVYKNSPIDNTFGNLNSDSKVANSISSLQGKEVIPFSEDIMRAVLASPQITSFEKYTSKYTIHSLNFGKFDFFPKANKIHLHSTNNWIYPGTNWLMGNF